MAMKAKHAFGMLENIDSAIAEGKIDSYDILFVKDADGKPYVGWVDKDGQKVIVENDADLSDVEAELAKKANVSDVEALETELATKADAKEVDAKIASAMEEHLTKKYEIADVPDGTLVKMGENEIRICCPADTVWEKQSVGATGDPNCYYATFKTYAPNDKAVGYIEHLNGQVDSEILTDLKTDSYGRKYQPTWLALAKYDEATNAWSYYGKNSSVDKYIGYDYQIDWYDADNKMIASDSIRINLSNEKCHSSIEPYYVGSIMKEVDTKIEEKIAEVESAYEIIEF